MSFYQDIIFRAMSTPGKIAVVQKGVAINYSQFARGMLAVAAEIRKLGLPQGSICAIINGSPLIDLTLTGALQHLGMVSLYANSLTSIEQVDLPVRLAIMMQGVTEKSTKFPTLVFQSDWLTGSPDQHEGVPQLRDMLAHICLSSGTTGRPKAIGFTNETIARRQMVKHYASSNVAWDKMLCVTGLGSSLGFGWANFALSSGKTVYFVGPDVPDQVRTISKYNIDFIVASVKQAAALVSASVDLDIATPSVRGMVVAGGVISPTIASNIVGRICADATALYGSTETGPSAFGPMRRVRDQHGWTGVLTPWTTIQILDEQGAVLPLGQEGSVRVGTEGRAFTLDSKGRIQPGDGWHYPGDRGVIGMDMSLRIIGRTDELINSGGVKVSPDAIDATLQRLPNIKDFATVGHTNAHGFNEIALVLVVAEDADRDAVKTDALREVKDAHALQGVVYFVESIPRNAMGKVERYRLTDMLRQQTQH